MAFIVVLCIVAVVGTTADPHSLEVQTVQGKIRGSILKTYTGKDVLSFRGVKYAESTGGQNRFKPPVPVKPWEGVRDATEDGILCPQPYIDNTAADPEDCLSLNVYTKTLEGKQPVMVFIHQGGFLTGTGYSRIAGPEYLLDKDIVLVTFNYRLGALGFLHTKDGVFTGNNGLKDQVAALHWVKQNIARFGGNPEEVTIFGNSAGSASVMYHMLSPMSRGLFVRGIAQSGAVLGGWPINRDPDTLARRLAGFLNCTGVSSQEIYNCMKDLDAQVIQNATRKIKDTVLDSYVNFAPVVEESNDDGQEKFLTDDPLHMIEHKRFTPVPLIVGVTTEETAFRSHFIMQNEKAVNGLDKEFKRYAPVEFHYERTGPTSERISDEIRKFYFGNKSINNETREQLGKIYTDSLVFPSVQVAKLLAEKSSAPVYFYQFDYEGRYSTYFYPGMRVKPGVAHSDDVLYILGNPLFLPIFNTTGSEANIIRTMTSMWTSFAATGNPNYNGISVDWKSLRKGEYKYLKISDSLKLENGLPFPERMAFWEKLFPLSGPHQIFY